MNKKCLQCFMILLFLISAPAYASTYYIDAINGVNTNSGLSPSQAWKTISKINSTSFAPGDLILFKRGQKWREQLNFPSSGTSVSRITIGAYDTGEKPVISGADIITGFTGSGNVWRKDIAYPQQVFFNEIRGFEQTSLSAVNSDKEWYWSPTTSTLYIYSVGNPSTVYTEPGIETTVRQSCIHLTQDYITIENLQLEKTLNSAVKITSTSQNIIVDNVTLYQWSAERNWEFDGDNVDGIGGIDIYGSNCEIKNSTLGKTTGNDIADQNWAGFLGIFINGPNNRIHHNNLYHNSTENEHSLGQKAYAIRLNRVGGTTEVFNNYIYHPGSHGILIRANTRSGDVIRIYDNVIEYPGQAGISSYKSRKEDGIGGAGYIYGNHISFANRLGGDVGGGGSQASGIHMNDGVKAGLDPARPYMKWYVFNNIVHNSQALKKPNGQDSGGISMDYNANETEVYQNLVYNNWGKGIYIWNASRCKVFYNIIYGNDTGSTITAASGTTEACEHNQVYNNTYYKNYNTDAFGPNYNTEVYFGHNGKFNILKNNIFFAHNNSLVYYFRDFNTTGNITDNNVVYKESGFYAWDTTNSFQSFAQWTANHPQWDGNSINANPQFVNAGAGNFNLLETSPAINSGEDLGLTVDFFGKPLNGIPDIGAVEFDPAAAAPLVIQSVNVNNANSVNIIFSKKVQESSAENPTNYSISNGVNVSSVLLGSNQNEVSITTSNHLANQSHVLTINNVRDVFGNLISPSGNTYTYNYVEPNSNNINLFAENGILNNGAALKTKTGSNGSQVAYCTSTSSTISFSVNLPNSGNWYAWGRVHYEGTSTQNSFFIKADNGTNKILGNDDNIFNQWHWDGYRSDKIDLGNLSAGQHLIVISGREPGSTVMLDQVILTQDPNFNPSSIISNDRIFLLAVNGILANGATLKNKSGSIGSQVAYCSSTSSTISFNVNLPKPGTWYAWGRMHYENTSTQNSFFIKVDNGSNKILGNDDNIFNQWHWDGYRSAKIDLGNLTAGQHLVVISGREPSPTVMLDQVVLTQDPDYNPNNQDPDDEFYTITLRASDGALANGGTLKTKAGSVSPQVAYCATTSSTISFTANIPQSGTWYAMGRLFYESTSTQNSFFIKVDNGSNKILGNNDNIFDQWHWDGYQSQKINLGTLSAGNHTFVVSGREPKSTVMIDLLLLTNNPDLIPLAKDISNEYAENNDVEIPDKFALEQNYPNPFNPSTIIKFSLAADQFVSLKIYNITGQEITTLVNEVKPAGIYNVEFNSSEIPGLASGVYFYILRAGSGSDGFVQTRKMLLMK